VPLLVGVMLIVVSGVAFSHALGRWPPIAPRFAAWQLADVVHAEANEARGGEALELGHRARVLRPMSAWYALAQAKRARDAGDARLARRSAEDVERLDPWDARKRLELMAIALDLGEEKTALRHGVVALALDPSQGLGSRGVLTQLERAGIEPALLATQLEEVPLLDEGGLPALMSTAMRAGAWGLAEALVPRPLEIGPEPCAAALQIARLLDRKKEREAALAHVAACEGFVSDEERRGRLSLWLARRRALQGEHELALEHLALVPAGPARARGALVLARAREDWPAVVRHAWAIIDDREHPPGESVVLWALHRMGEANARQGQIEAAIRNYEEIVKTDPLDTRAEEYLATLRAGHSPFD
jgi:tetratricopeptide (TPR) repeat protein